MINALVNATLFTGEETIEMATVLVNENKIENILPANSPVPSSANIIDIDGRRLVPGFIDIQVNGGGDVMLNSSPTVDGIRTICSAHLQFGSTSILPTLITTDKEVMRQAIGAIREALDLGMPGVLGIHLEGPLLNPTRKGAHSEEKIRAVESGDLALLTSLGTDAVTVVTMAPELVDNEFIRRLRKAGIIVFAGHTAATYEDCLKAELAGLSGYTHLYNAMTPLTSRAPGVVGAAISSEKSVFTIIADGHHSHPASFKMACDAKYRSGAILVTDAMSTIGGDREGFELDGEFIAVCDGVLRNRRGSLAGSHITMIDSVKNAMRFANLNWQEAVRMASVYPARAIGVSNSVGLIASSRYANFVELDHDMNIFRVWQHGEICTS